MKPWNKDEVIERVTKLLNQIFIDGITANEENKVDYKRDWYNWGTKNGKSEFVKDATAIVNTIGLDGLIIIGVDEKRKVFGKGQPSDVGINDVKELSDQIAKRTDRGFPINYYPLTYDHNGKTHVLSVIHIPPSVDIPHMIQNYQAFDATDTPKYDVRNAIFIRRGTSNEHPTKSELETIYAFRGNIQSEYKMYITLHKPTFYINGNIGSQGEVRASLTIENVGKRPIAINQLTLQLIFNPETYSRSIITLAATHNRDSRTFGMGESIMSKPIIIQPNNIENHFLFFQYRNDNWRNETERQEASQYLQSNHYTTKALVNLTSGHFIEEKIETTG